MTEPVKRKVGKPNWVPPNPKIVEKLAKRGLNMKQIANCLNIGMSTLCAKRHEYPEFEEAIKRGQDKGIKIIANALFESAKKGNVVAQLFYLKARAGWYDDSALRDMENRLKELVKKQDSEENRPTS